jgi:hypothetical protein
MASELSDTLRNASITTDRNPAPDWLQQGSRHATLLIGALTSLKLAFLFFFALNTRFVMDEFVQFGWSKYLANGLYDTIWPAKAAGAAVFYELAHLLGWSAVSMLLIGRIQTALIACAILAIVFVTARALGQNRLRSLLIVLFLLSFSNFIERSFRTIAEPLALFFGAMALLTVLRGRVDQPRRLLAAGMLSGLAVIATQKSVYFNISLGLALVADAALAYQFVAGIRRGLILVLGWIVPIVVYCLAFGGTDPIAVASNLFFGPVQVATTGADAYPNGLRHFVGQTLLLNPILYFFGFVGIALRLRRIKVLKEHERIALIFTIGITVLIFAHNQPWPYVFIMAQPFIALWSLVPFDRMPPGEPKIRVALSILLAIACISSFVRNFDYLRYDNRDQMTLVARAESLLGPREVYFDGVGMLPNRFEPSSYWLDAGAVAQTRADGDRSEVHRIFETAPPKLVLWSYRLDNIQPVIEPLLRNRYVKIGPNLLIAGSRLRSGSPTDFDVPISGRYALYTKSGQPLKAEVGVDGVTRTSPFFLAAGRKRITISSGGPEIFLLPADLRLGPIDPLAEDKPIFAGVYG